MATIEDNIRSTIKQNESALFELRKDSVKYLTFNSGGKSPVFDLQYMSEIREVQAKEKLFAAAILQSQNALTRAAALVRGISGTNPDNPLSSLIRVQEIMQKELETLERDITLYERKTASDKPFIDTHEWKQRKKECENRLKELKPELEKLKKIREEIENIFQRAGVTI